MFFEKTLWWVFLASMLLGSASANADTVEPIQKELAIALTQEDIYRCSGDEAKLRCLHTQMNIAYDLLVESRNVVWRIDVALEEKPPSEVFPAHEQEMVAAYMEASAEKKKELLITEIFPAIHTLTARDDSDQKSYQVVADSLPMHGLLLTAAVSDSIAEIAHESAQALLERTDALTIQVEANAASIESGAFTVLEKLRTEWAAVWQHSPWVEEVDF